MQNPQFAYKLEWLKRLGDYLARRFSARQQLILCGDLNVARETIDVHNPKKLLGHVDFNPEVWEAFDRIKAWGLVDVFEKAPSGRIWAVHILRLPGSEHGGKGVGLACRSHPCHRDTRQKVRGLFDRYESETGGQTIGSYGNGSALQPLTHWLGTGTLFMRHLIGSYNFAASTAAPIAPLTWA